MLATTSLLQGVASRSLLPKLLTSQSRQAVLARRARSCLVLALEREVLELRATGGWWCERLGGSLGAVVGTVGICMPMLPYLFFCHAPKFVP